MQKDRKAFMAFSIIDVHTYELASVVTESQTETNINHFQVTSSIIFPKVAILRTPEFLQEAIECPLGEA